MDEFVHLHVHSEYSLLDGLADPKDLVQRAAEMGMPALAITDHGTMYGVVEFYQAAKDAGIKPLIGVEAYLAPRTLHDRSKRSDGKPHHVVLLAQNQTGYKNLLKLSSIAMLEGFYYKPRIDKQVLEEYGEGLIVTSACVSGEIPRLIRQGRNEEAERVVAWYKDRFPGRFFLELQQHDIQELPAINRGLIDLARRYDVPLVATNDIHYVDRNDAATHDILLCIGTGKVVGEADRMRMDGDTFYMRSPAEMAHLFAEVPEALTNTLRVAEMCDVEIEFGHYHLPNFDVPEGHTAESYLRRLCLEGLRWRYGDRDASAEVMGRLEHELGIIHTMGFDTYFLIVWDLCQAAKQRGIWYNARGSAAGSIVAYSLGITMVDPLANDLIFERFLNPGRISMPDIDLDFPDDRRGELIDYTIEKYHQENVAQIITFGTLGARAAVRDVGRALDIPLGDVDQVARLIPNVPGKPVSIEQALESVPDLRAIYETRPYIKRLLDAAAKLEGVARHASTHAAGVIIADTELTNYCPLNRPTKGVEASSTEEEESVLNAVTQWPMEQLESIGLLKVDFLGLRTLTIMHYACDLIEKRHGIAFNLDNIPLDDPQIYRLIASGDVSGVFQVEGAGFRRVLKDMRPSRYEHIVAVLALYRPGPMEYIPNYIRRLHGEEEVEYRHPALEPILAETFGITVFQEQIMRAATNLAGYTASEADFLRKAVAKKKKEELLKHREQFVGGAVQRGISEHDATGIFEDWEAFARYGFPKGHAADYAVLTCQTAYLKAHYPLEYMAALLSVERNNVEKVGFLVTECRRMGIVVLPPDVNHSELDFAIEQTEQGEAIRYGLGAVKNVGDGPVQEIVARRAGQSFENLQDFCRRVDLRTVNRRALECLIKVGALAALGDRPRLLAALDRIMGLSARMHQAQDVGQLSLFGEATGVQLEGEEDLFAGLGRIVEPSQREVLDWEKELAGTYISESPLSQPLRELADFVTTQIAQLEDEQPEQTVTLLGVVRRIRRHMTRSKGEEMAFVTLEDLSGSCDVVVFPRVWEQTKAVWVPDRIVVVCGRVSSRRDDMGLICEWVKLPHEMVRPREPLPRLAAPPADIAPQPVQRPTRQRTVKITLRRSGDQVGDFALLSAVHEVLVSYSGQDRFVFVLKNGPNGDQLLEFPNDVTHFCPELGMKLADIVGPEAVSVEEAG
ncbi:MAG: DNA polymerase III subunit alpha [Anaerolineae bacterium]|nr:DNA polymerase III subunit alpha [Anaerolineae bacterium]